MICVDAVDAVDNGCCWEWLRILTCKAFFGRIGTRGRRKTPGKADLVEIPCDYRFFFRNNIIRFYLISENLILNAYRKVDPESFLRKTKFGRLVTKYSQIYNPSASTYRLPGNNIRRTLPYSSHFIPGRRILGHVTEEVPSPHLARIISMVTQSQFGTRLGT
jgi:hypothetical protein